MQMLVDLTPESAAQIADKAVEALRRAQSAYYWAHKWPTGSLAHPGIYDRLRHYMLEELLGYAPCCPKDEEQAS